MIFTICRVSGLLSLPTLDGSIIIFKWGVFTYYKDMGMAIGTYSSQGLKKL